MTMEKNSDQYSFWGLHNEDPWDALHAHFEKQSRDDDAVVEEVRITGKAKPK